jgi:DNA-binding NarL/FixJ family response regulator
MVYSGGGRETPAMPVRHISPPRPGVAPLSAPSADLRVGVLLVDNQDIVHVGLRVLLLRQPWVTRVVSARRGQDAVLLAERHAPRVALVDLFVGEEYGIHICSAIRERAPGVRVLLTSSTSTLTQHAARVAGAAGFVAKDCTAAELLGAIRSVAAGSERFVWSPEVARGPLSRRQQQILNLMAEGATNPRIADTLGLSVDTVKHHTTLIYKRLAVPHRAAAVHLAQRLGLLTGTQLTIAGGAEPTRHPAQPPIRHAA